MIKLFFIGLLQFLPTVMLHASDITRMIRPAHPSTLPPIAYKEYSENPYWKIKGISHYRNLSSSLSLIFPSLTSQSNISSKKVSIGAKKSPSSVISISKKANLSSNSIKIITPTAKKQIIPNKSALGSVHIIKTPILKDHVIIKKNTSLSKVNLVSNPQPFKSSNYVKKTSNPSSKKITFTRTNVPTVDSASATNYTIYKHRHKHHHHFFLMLDKSLHALIHDLMPLNHQKIKIFKSAYGTFLINYQYHSLTYNSNTINPLEPPLINQEPD